MDILQLHPLLQRNKTYKVFDFTGTGAIRKPRRYIKGLGYQVMSNTYRSNSVEIHLIVPYISYVKRMLATKINHGEKKSLKTGERH